MFKTCLKDATAFIYDKTFTLGQVFFYYKKKIGELLCMKIRIESTFFQIRFCTSEKEVFNGTTSFALLSWPYSS